MEAGQSPGQDGRRSQKCAAVERGNVLFEVAPLDPLILVAAPLIFASVALAACAVPAVRAARIEPAVCLRAE